MNTQAEAPLVEFTIETDGIRPRKRWVVLVRRVRPLAALLCVVAAGVGGFVAGAGGERVVGLISEETTATTEVFVDLPEMIVNLRPGAPSRFLKIAVTLATTEADKADVERATVRVVDAEHEFMRNLDEHDLNGSAGLARLRDEFRRRVNLIIGRPAVADVLLRGLLTQ